MEPDDLKLAWQTLDARLQRQETLQREWLTEQRIERVRSRLKPLFLGQLLQSVFSLMVMLIGIACWRGHGDVPQLLLAGAMLHGYGLASLVIACVVMVQIARIDPCATVLDAQRQVQQLQRLHAINGLVAGLPWALLWIPLVIALAALGGLDIWPALSAAMPIQAKIGMALGGAIAVPVIVLLMTRSGRQRGQPWQQALVDAFAGPRLREARARLADIERFARE